MASEGNKQQCKGTQDVSFEAWYVFSGSTSIANYTQRDMLYKNMSTILLRL